MKISKTPETDGHLIEVLDVTGKVVVTDKVYAGFARKLEIERNKLQMAVNGWYHAKTRAAQSVFDTELARLAKGK